MTEQEWLECSEPQKMLGFLRTRLWWLPWRNCTFSKVSKRKMLLFACTCYRRSSLFHTVRTTNLTLEAISVMERWLDGQASSSELEAARTYCFLAERRNVWSIAKYAAWHEAFSAGLWAGFNQEVFLAAKSHQCILLRDIVGSLFRPVTINPAWLDWKDGTVQKMAQAIYDDRAFDRLPILADALEEAGCTNLDIPNHCRQPGEHVRGCWVVDLCLGKE